MSCNSENAHEADQWAVSHDLLNTGTITSHTEHFSAVLPDDLCKIITAWPNLPVPIKVGIMAMIKTATTGEQ